jgi:hypothetical protein
MTNYKFIVLTDPVAGQEDEYNNWYTNRHLDDVVGLEGFAAAQRFRFIDPDRDSDEPAPTRYLAIYDVSEDQIEQAKESLAAAAEERESALAANREPSVMPISSALGGRITWWCEAITDRVEA